MAERDVLDLIALNVRAPIGWTRVHAIFIKARVLKGALSDGSDGLLGDGWMLGERSNFNERSIVIKPCDFHRTAKIISSEIVVHDQGP